MTASLRNLVRPKTLIKLSKRYLKGVLGPTIRRYSKQRTDLPLELWRLSHDAEGKLYLGEISLRSLLEQYGSPLHVVDATKLRQNIAEFMTKPAGAQRACEVYYSYKTNPVPGILKLLHNEGIGAEVISEYELWLALKLGVDPKNIVYNGPGKSKASLRQAIDQEIELLNFNCREEIAPFAEMARHAGKRPRVGIRAVVPGGWGGQFGEPVPGGAALRAFEEAVAHPELEVVALHVHRGGEIATGADLQSFVQSVLAFADEVHARLGLNLEVLDFGGSLACPTTVHLTSRDVRFNTAFHADLVPRPPESVLSIREYTTQVVAMVERHYAEVGRPVPRIFLEPGRAMTGNTQMLLCSVMITKQENEELSYAILDAGINIAEPIRNEYHQLFPVERSHSRRRRTYRLVGPICTPADVLYHAWELPELAPGDALAIMDSGAYFVPFSTSFSFPQPAIVLVDEDQTSLLRHAERFEDLVALDKAPEVSSSTITTRSIGKGTQAQITG